MKIVLLQPPVEDFYDTDIRLQPLGLCYLKAALRQFCSDVEVTVCDFHHGWGRKTVAIPDELKYLKPFYSSPNQSPFSSFHQFYHFGADYQTVAAEVAALAPDIVGISALFTPYYREVLKCAAAIKKVSTAKIVIGGGQASCCPKLMLSSLDVDFVIVGQGEKPLVDLVDALQREQDFTNIPGLGWKRNGRLVINPRGPVFPFSELPIPDLSDLPVGQYLYQGKPIAFIQTSRGCPYRCGFCSVHQIFGRKFERRSSEHIIEEMQLRFEQGYRVFDFEDDNLTFDQQEFIRLCELIAKRFDVSQIQLLAMNGISYGNIDEQILAHMKRAGFSRLNLALVSADQKLLRSVGRPHQVEGLAVIAEKAFELGFELEVHMIIGLPGDTVDEMIHTMVLLAGLPVLIGVSTFYLTPGTDAAKSFPALTENDIYKARSTAMAITSEACSRSDLFTLFICARIINFVKGLHADPESGEVVELFGQQFSMSKRDQLGAKLLKKLLNENILLGCNGGKYFEVKKFDHALFQNVWGRIDVIATQQGKRISLNMMETHQDEH